MQSVEPPRWTYRFKTYHRGLCLLREAIALKQERALSDLEREGTAQRFEYTWELAWKTLKDVLEFEGVQLATITPATTLKAAFAAGLITDAEGWLAALDARNKLAHVYSASTFSEITETIEARFLALLDALDERLLERLMSEGWA